MQRTRLSRLNRLALLIGFALASGTAAGSDWPLDTGAFNLAPETVTDSTLQVRSPFSESLRLRLGLATTRFHSYIGDEPLRQNAASEPIASALLDYHFNRWGLRFTGGALYSAPTERGLLAYDAREANPATGLYNGAYLNGYGSSRERDQVLPYLGMGWGQAFGSEQRLQLKMDFGIAFQGVTDLDGTPSAESRGYAGGSVDNYRLNDDSRWEDQFQSLRYSFSAGVRYRF